MPIEQQSRRRLLLFSADIRKRFAGTPMARAAGIAIRPMARTRL
jgi:hypothetical protein